MGALAAAAGARGRHRPRRLISSDHRDAALDRGGSSCRSAAATSAIPFNSMQDSDPATTFGFAAAALAIGGHIVPGAGISLPGDGDALRLCS